MGRTEADIQAAQLLAGFGGAGFAPPASKGLSFRPPSFGRAQPLPPLARVAEEGDGGRVDAGLPPHPQLQTATPPQLLRPQRPSVTPLTSAPGQHQDGGSPTMQELPPLQSPLPPPMRPSGAMPRGGINRTETADSYTSQALREYAAGKAGGKSAGSGRLPGKAEPMFVGPSRPRTAAARALLAGTTLHPVVRLGWKPLCEVHCNGLTGFFLGGHDRDLYIKCTSAEYRYLPMVDVSQDGCIMTCSHFEKAAGRELSKKWKESIHVAGEGEGSKATLVSWLKRRAEADFGAAVVGCHVWVCWCADAEYYMGEIISYSRENGKHKVKYSDRFVEELHLPVEKLDFGPTKPTISFDPADCGFSELAHRQAGEVGSINRSRSAPAATLRAYAANYASAGLLHQCSNVSASSEFNEEQLLPPCAAAATAPPTAERPAELRRSRLRDTSPTQLSPTLSEEAQQAMRLPPVAVSRRRRTGAALPEQLPSDAGGGAGSSSVSEESDATPGAPPPKKRRSGSGRPSAAGQEFAARLADADAAAHPLMRTASLDYAPTPPARAPSMERATLERGASLDRPRPSAPSFSAWSPAERKVAVQQHAAFASPQSLASAPPQPALDARAPPPAAGHDETSTAVMSRWMNRVAMALDDALVARASTMTAAAEQDARVDGEAGGSTAAGWAASPSARFQALLVHARRHDSLPGYYEAMLERWEFFKEQPAALEAKMADLILAFCASGEQPPTPRSPPRAALPARSATPQEASDAV